MAEALKFFLSLDPLVLGMGGFGVLIIGGVLVLNSVQMRRARAREARTAANASVDTAASQSQAARAMPMSAPFDDRREPSLGAPMHEPDAATLEAAPTSAQSLSVEHAHNVDRIRAEPSTEVFEEVSHVMPDEQGLRDAHEVDIELTPPASLNQASESGPLPLGPNEPTAPIDTRVHSVVKLRFASPLATESAKHLTDRIADRFPRGLIWTWSAGLGAWSASRSPAAANHPANTIAFAMPLASRHGAVTESALREWMGDIARAGEAAGADVIYASVHEDAKRAVELDQFCGNLDLMAGVNLMRADHSAMPGTRVRGTLEAEGFRLLPEGYFQLMSEDGTHAIYEIRSLHNQPMSADTLRHEGVHGLSLTLDVMRAPNPVQHFDLMRALSKRLALRLEATVVDDRGHALSDNHFTQIRRDLEARVTAARTAGIEPGSPLARTLFGD